jgi:ATP-binding cassette, subfamily C (CFTR/MRP), member 1
MAMVTAYTVQVLSPFLTFSSYSGIAIKNHGVLDSARLFSSLSIIALLTSPLNYLLQVYFGMMAALACIDRIEEFCMSDDIKDGRTLRGDAANGAHYSSQAITDIDSDHHFGSKAEKSGSERSYPTHLNQGEAIVVDQATFGWDKDPVVKNACFSINYSQLTIISGPNGSGKSSLLKALLGEVPLSKGAIALYSKDIAFCDQLPWLPNMTIQQCILGYNLFNAKLYSNVVYTCALDEDFESMDDGDKTKVGSKGATRVSGGQMHRIALARALYSKKRIYLLDDVFSALDNRTQQLLFERLFGPDGFLKRMNAAIVMVSSLSRHLSIADQVIHLKADGWLSVENRNQDLEIVSPVYSGDSNDGIAQKAYPFHPPSSSPESNEESERSREIGDRAVYLYYAKSVGLFGCVIYVILGITNIVLTKFPGMQYSFISQFTANELYRNMDAMVGGLQ